MTPSLNPIFLLWRADAALFLGSAAALLTVWLGYPAVMGLCAHWRQRPPARTPPAGPWPSLTVIVAAHNEAAHIEERLHDLFAQNYPGALEILVSEDGSTDDTVAVVRAFRPRAAAVDPGAGGEATANAPVVRLLTEPGRLGKAAALNRAAAAARGDILVFSDANNHYAPGTLRELAAPFADPEIGAVNGCKTVCAATGVGGGESVYWKFEHWLTRQESAAGSTVASFGEVLALRRDCFRRLPEAVMLNDDRYLSWQVLAQGRRVVMAPAARSFELPSAHAGAEWERRNRMTAGRWQSLASLRGQWAGISWPVRVRLLFHEILRPVSALWLLLGLLTGLPLLAAPARTLGPVTRGLAYAQAGLAAWVLAVALGRRLGHRLGALEAPYFFVLALGASLAGWWRYLRRRQSPLWRRVERGRPAPAAPPVTSGHILRGLFWAGSSFFLGKLLVFGSVIILARLLAPQEFGEVALAISAITVLEILGTLGLTSALIYEEREVLGVAQVCFWFTLAAAVFETALCWAGAPWLAAFYHQPQLVPMLRVLSFCLVFYALGNTHDTLLRRQLAFQRKLLPDMAMAAAKGIASIILALLGFGAWSIIWGQLLGVAASTAFLWYLTPFRPAWGFERRLARRAFQYGKHIYLLDGSSAILTNLDSLTIGRMIGAAALGFYSLAFRIPEVLLLSLLNVVTRVIFPAFSRLQTDRANLRETLLQTSRYTALATFPIAAGLAILAREVVVGFYGWKWEVAAPVLRVLAIYAGIRCLAHHFGDAYKAIGRPDILVKATAVWWVLLPPCLILGAHWGGLVGVAWGQIVARVAMTALHCYLVVAILKVEPRRLLQCFAPALEATAVMTVTLLLIHPWSAILDPRPQVLVLALVGAAVYFACLFFRYPAVLAVALSRFRWLPARRAAATPAPGPVPAAAAGAEVESFSSGGAAGRSAWAPALAGHASRNGASSAGPLGLSVAGPPAGRPAEPGWGPHPSLERKA